MTAPAPSVAAEGTPATVYVGTLISPTKPLVEITGPEKVVLAIGHLLHKVFALQSVQSQAGWRPVCKAKYVAQTK
jgi:hypothetical protein